MKKNLILIVIIVAVVGLIVVFFPSQSKGEELIRIHIRANSNSTDDQAVKYTVRDEVVSYLTPYLEGAGTRENAYAIIETHEAQLNQLVNKTLSAKGFSYSCTIRLLNEYFPVRSYEDITVEAGYYDALIIELGNGNGDNWWCVVYPPLCFASPQGEGKLVYKSKLIELLKGNK